MLSGNGPLASLEITTNLPVRCQIRAGYHFYSQVVFNIRTFLLQLRTSAKCHVEFLHVCQCLGVKKIFVS